VWIRRGTALLCMTDDWAIYLLVSEKFKVYKVVCQSAT
jgi:hypothetical protein